MNKRFCLYVFLAVFILLSAAKDSVILPLTKPDWLNCPCDKDNTLGLAYCLCQVI